jgi:thiosulfate reductase cytochrome b subunit
MKEKNRIQIRKTAAYFSIATVILYIVTGYGITQYRTVEKLTFGLLSKSLSFKIHSWLIIPLIIFLFTHLYFSCDLLRGFGKNGKNKKD